MTPQELKSSILQLAIQGKLVEQRPEEGTAEELYQQIQQEKQVLIREGKIKKEKLFPEITEDEKPFDIPESWKWIHLNQIAESSLGKTLDKAKNTGDMCPYLCSINVYWTGIVKDTVKQARFTEEDKVKYRLKKGDLLICEGGDIGRTAIWYSDEEMYYQNALHRVRFYGNILPEYYRYLLECYKSAGILDEYSKGMTIKHLVQNSLYSMWMSLPPLAEQKRIVAKIEELLLLIDRYEKAWNRLEEFNKRFPDDLQKSLLQMAIQGKLVEQRAEEGTGEELYQRIQIEKHNQIASGKAKKGKEFSEIKEEEKPFIIPTNWKWVHLNSIYNFIDYRGITPNKLDAGIRLIGSGNIRKRHLDFSKEDKYISSVEYETRKSRGLTKEGDILFITEGGSMGFASLNTWKGECSCGQRVITFQQYGNHPLLDNEFFLNCILSEYFQHAIRERITGSAALGIKGDTLKRVFVPLPPLAEQQRIVAKLEELLPLCEKLK